MKKKKKKKLQVALVSSSVHPLYITLRNIVNFVLTESVRDK